MLELLISRFRPHHETQTARRKKAQNVGKKELNKEPKKYISDLNQFFLIEFL